MMQKAMSLRPDHSPPPDLINRMLVSTALNLVVGSLNFCSTCTSHCKGEDCHELVVSEVFYDSPLLWLRVMV
jgi:hypothetical protein